MSMLDHQQQAAKSKARFPAAEARAVANEIVAALAGSCAQIIVAGSLRRGKQSVGDVEILYIPKTGAAKGDELFALPCNLADVAIAVLEQQFVLSRRQNVNGSEVFGDRNKLMRHTLSGIPVDLFSTSEESWFNYLVCRTGGAESNTRIASLAKDRGYQWNPYSCGFTDRHDGRVFPMSSEEDVFAFVGLPYETPEARA